MRCLLLALLTVSLVGLLAQPVSAQITLNQIDDFEDNTVQGWVSGAPNPTPPTNSPNGGPTGTGDNFLLIQGAGGGGPGSRATSFNSTQWSGNYVSEGVGQITMDIRPVNNTLNIRLLIEGPGGNFVTNDVANLSGNTWQSATFSLLPVNLVDQGVGGNPVVTLSGVTQIRIFDNPSAAFVTGGGSGPPAAALVFGVDNMTATAAALPVELTAFEALAEGPDAVLQWHTGTELQNAGFEVHQQDLAGTWQTLGFVEGAGVSATGVAYSYRVEGLAAGQHRFRLRQIDFDGTASLSPVVEVTIEVPGTYVLTDAYPNPFNPSTQFSLVVSQEQQVRVAVYDLLGREVLLLQHGRLAANMRQPYQLDASALPSGTYLIQVVGETFHDTRSVTLLK